MELALLACHLSNASLDEVADWSLRQCVEVVSHHDTVMPLLVPHYSRPERAVTDPRAAESVARAFGLVKR